MEQVAQLFQRMLETEQTMLENLRYLNQRCKEHLISLHYRNASAMIILISSMNQPVTMTLSLPESFLSPVEVFPTMSQINNAVSRGIRCTNITCAICQENVEVATQIDHCNHKFHEDCITNWFSRSVRCPVCRWDIRNQDEPTDEEMSEGEDHL